MSRAPRTRKRSVTVFLGTVVASVLVVLVGSPATAGGWWTYPQLDTEPMSPGEEITVSASVMFRSAEEAEAAASQYYAYLVRGIDQQALQEAMSQGEPHGWWTTPDEIVLLGPLEFGELDTNVRHVSGTFVVPDIETGVYSLMLCTLGCAEPLGDVIPREGVYVGDQSAVRWIRDARETGHQILGRFDDLEARLQRLHRSAAGLGGRIDAVDTRVGEVGRSVDGVELSLSMLRERVDELEGAAGPSLGWMSWAGWFVAGLALAVAWSSRRTMGRDRPAAPDDLDALDLRADGDAAPAPEFVTSFTPR